MLKLAVCYANWNYLQTCVHMFHMSVFYPFPLYFHPSFAHPCLHFSTLLLPSPYKHIPNLVCGMNFTPESSLWKVVRVRKNLAGCCCLLTKTAEQSQTKHVIHVWCYIANRLAILSLGWVVGTNAPVFQSVKL